MNYKKLLGKKSNPDASVFAFEYNTDPVLTEQDFAGLRHSIEQLKTTLFEKKWSGVRPSSPTSRCAWNSKSPQ